MSGGNRRGEQGAGQCYERRPSGERCLFLAPKAVDVETSIGPINNGRQPQGVADRCRTVGLASVRGVERVADGLADPTARGNLCPLAAADSRILPSSSELRRFGALQEETRRLRLPVLRAAAM